MQPETQRAANQWPAWILAIALAAWVAVLAAKNPVPSEDGVSYLWMAQQFAAGHVAAALALVFPPGFPLLMAPLIGVGIEPIVAGVFVGAGCLGLTVVPLWRLASMLSPGAGAIAALLLATSSLLPRVAAEIYSEPPFLFLMAWGTWWGLRERWWLVGMAAGMAFWCRPEGLLLAVSFVLVRRAAWRALLPGAAFVLLLGLARWLAGHGFDALPIHGFHEQRDDLSERGDVLHNLIAVPSAWLEAFGPVALLPCLLFAARRMRGSLPAASTRVLWWQIALQIAVVCTFVVRRRFLLSCAIPTVVLAALGARVLPTRWRRAVLALSAAIGVLLAWRGGIDADRRIERELGEHLAAQLAPGQGIASDLTRVLWFAGQQPLPPRHFSAEQLAAFAAPERVRFVVLSIGSHRQSSRDAVPLLESTFAPCELPPALRDRCTERGLLVLARR